MAYVPRVNRHVAYLQQKTVNGDANYVKRRSARVTAVLVGTNTNLQVGHHGETYANVVERTDPDSNTTGTYVTY